MTVVDLCPFFWNAMCISQFKGLALLCLIRNTCFTVHGWWWWHIFLNSMIQHHIHHDSYNAWNWHPFPGAIKLIKSIIMSSHPITYMCCCCWWWFLKKILVLYYTAGWVAGIPEQSSSLKASSSAWWWYDNMMMTMMISRAVLYSLLGRRHPWAIKSGQVTTLATPLTHLPPSVIIIIVIIIIMMIIDIMCLSWWW